MILMLKNGLQVRTNTFKLTSIPNYEVYLHTGEFPIHACRLRPQSLIRLSRYVKPFKIPIVLYV
jgi:hypothetical protein